MQSAALFQLRGRCIAGRVRELRKQRRFVPQYLFAASASGGFPSTQRVGPPWVRVGVPPDVVVHPAQHVTHLLSQGCRHFRAVPLFASGVRKALDGSDRVVGSVVETELPRPGEMVEPGVFQPKPRDVFRSETREPGDVCEQAIWNVAHSIGRHVRRVAEQRGSHQSRRVREVDELRTRSTVSFDRLRDLERFRNRPKTARESAQASRFLSDESPADPELLVADTRLHLPNANLADDDVRTANGLFQIRVRGEKHSALEPRYHARPALPGGREAALIDVQQANLAEPESTGAPQELFDQLRGVGAAGTRDRDDVFTRDLRHVLIRLSRFEVGWSRE